MKNVKMISRIIAATMVLSTLPALGISASAEVKTTMDWAEQFSEDFSGSTLDTEKTGIKYATNTDAVKLKDGYAVLTPSKVTANQKDGVGADSKWCIALDANAFKDAADADAVKLEYKIMFSDLSKQGSNTTTWNEHQGLHTKVYATSRAWSVRITPEKWQLDGGSAAYSDAAAEEWYTVTHIYTKSDKTLVSTVSVNNDIINTKTVSGPISGYLFGCDNVGYGINIDDITVSYGTIVPVGEDYTITFDTLENEHITYNEACSPVLTDNSLSLTGNTNTKKDGYIGATNWGAIAEIVPDPHAGEIVISYRAKLSTTEASGDTAWWGNANIADKLIIPSSSSSTGYVRSWGARTSMTRTQLFDSSADTTVTIPDGNEWVYVEYRYNASDQTTTATLTQNGKVFARGSKKTGIPSALMLATVNNCGTVYYDDIKVSYDPEGKFDVNLGNGNYVTGKNNTGATWYIADVTASGYTQTFNTMTLTDRSNENKTATKDLTTAITLADGASVSIGIIIDGGNYTEHNITATVQ